MTILRQISLLNIANHLEPDSTLDYLEYPFEVPLGASKVGAVLRYLGKRKITVLFLTLFSPDGFCGHKMKPGGNGDIELEIWVSPDQASPGAPPGRISAGTWKALIDVRVLKEATDYTLTAYAETGSTLEYTDFTYPSAHITRAGRDWYKGELHMHSLESDGKFPVDVVVRAAQEAGLDFISLTDHTTCSQWRHLAGLVNHQTALIRSLEITGHSGHANLHGLHKWVNVYVDRPGWDINRAAEAVHAQGGLFCVNHAFSGNLSWRHFDLDWRLVDLEEIYHNLEGVNNNAQISLWDQHLNMGYRIVGIGGTDSHDPFTGLDRLGQVVTWVEADELSEQGVIAGLKRGRVYVSRGPEFRFSAHDQRGQRAEMWESLSAPHSPITFQVQVKWDQPLRMFVFKNGLIYKIQTLAPQGSNWQTVEFTDADARRPGIYRIELHDEVDNPDFPGIMWRDFSTVRVLSNPILVN